MTGPAPLYDIAIKTLDDKPGTMGDYRGKVLLIVNVANAHPLYSLLTAQRPGVLGTEPIKWKFTKFFVGRDGAVLERYAPTTTPEAIESPIQAALKQPS